MDFFMDLYHKALQSPLWQSVFSHLSWIDWLTVGAVVLGFLNGLRQPLVKAFRVWAAAALAIYGALEFHADWDKWAGPWLGFFSREVGLAVSFIALGLLAFTLLKILFWVITFFLERPAESVPVIFLGVLFSIATNLFLLALAAHMILLSPWGHLKKVFGQGDSYSGYSIARLSHQVHDALAGPLASVRQRIPR